MAISRRAPLILLGVIVLLAILFAGCGNESAGTSPKLDTNPPAVPLELTAQVVAGAGVSLSWAANTVDSDLRGYIAYRSESPHGGFAPLNRDPVTTNSLLDRSAKPGHSYWYQVAARDVNRNESARSASTAVSLSASSRTQLASR
ncbi:MAG TPA: fibronectin type III domain-containing protein [Candidatus Krumholzibacteria bacterium]|nr:fibronectin type III domain-containing protein [Candidatus Krumholzibacteria bacterium]